MTTAEAIVKLGEIIGYCFIIWVMFKFFEKNL